MPGREKRLFCREPRTILAQAEAVLAKSHCCAVRSRLSGGDYGKSLEKGVFGPGWNPLRASVSQASRRCPNCSLRASNRFKKTESLRSRELIARMQRVTVSGRHHANWAISLRLSQVRQCNSKASIRVRLRWHGEKSANRSSTPIPVPDAPTPG